MARLSPFALAAAVVATSLSVIAPAGAAPARDPNSAVVHYGDLDLTTDAGRTMLDRRVRHAVNSLCHVNAEREIAMIQLCRTNLMESTTPQVQLAIRDSANRLADADSSFRAVLR
jgi:UrcA family protein